VVQEMKKKKIIITHPGMTIDPSQRLTDYPMQQMEQRDFSNMEYFGGHNGMGARNDDAESKSTESSFISE